MAFRITPSLGPDVDQVFPAAGGYWFAPQTDRSLTAAPLPSYQLLSTVIDSVGEQRRWVKAGSSQIAANAQVTISDDGVATAGSGGWYAKAIVPANGYFHATNVNPA